MNLLEKNYITSHHGFQEET